MQYGLSQGIEIDHASFKFLFLKPLRDVSRNDYRFDAKLAKTVGEHAVACPFDIDKGDAGARSFC